MNGMAKKKRPGRRHKPRRTISLTPLLYAQLAILARRHERPVAWQGRIGIKDMLRAEGLWPVPGVPDEDEGEGTDTDEEITLPEPEPKKPRPAEEAHRRPPRAGVLTAPRLRLFRCTDPVARL